jgi:hypothetical protein
VGAGPPQAQLDFHRPVPAVDERPVRPGGHDGRPRAGGIGEHPVVEQLGPLGLPRCADTPSRALGPPPQPAVVDRGSHHHRQQPGGLPERVGLGQPCRGGPDPGRARIRHRQPQGLVKGVPVAAAPHRLPPHEPEIPEPGHEVAPSSPLPCSSLFGQDLLLHGGEGPQEELPACGHQGQEDGLLQAGQRSVLGPGHPDGYGQFGHVASFGLGLEGTLRAPLRRVGDFRKDWLRADAIELRVGA